VASPSETQEEADKPTGNLAHDLWYQGGRLRTDLQASLTLHPENWHVEGLKQRIAKWDEAADRYFNSCHRPAEPASPSAPETPICLCMVSTSGYIYRCHMPDCPNAPAAPATPQAEQWPPLTNPLRNSKHWDDGVDRPLAAERAARLEREDQLSAAMSEVERLKEVLENGEKMYIVMRNRCANTEAELATLEASHDRLLAGLKRLADKCYVYGGPKGGKMDLSVERAAISAAEELRAK